MIHRVMPDCFVLVETDLWPNLLWTLKQFNIPALLVNGSISSRSYRHMSLLPPVADFLYGPFSMIVMQSEDDRGRLLGLGVKAERVRVAGNLKYDIPPDRPEGVTVTRHDMGFQDGTFIFGCGSTHRGEEKILIKAFLAVREGRRETGLVVAPRDPARGGEIEELARSAGLVPCLRTMGRPGGRVDVFILDTLGELASFYPLFDAAFVGGTLVPEGGHNILEPAACGLPVCYGPYTESVREAADALCEAGGGTFVSNEKDIEEWLERLLRYPDVRLEHGRAAAGFVKRNRGAAEHYVELIADAIKGAGR